MRTNKGLVHALVLQGALLALGCAEDNGDGDAGTEAGESVTSDDGTSEESSSESTGEVLDPYGLCDYELGQENNPDCPFPGSSCNGWQCEPPCMSGPTGEGPGDECPDPLTGTATKTCYVSVCVLSCEGGLVCPDGMGCNVTCRWPEP